MRKAWCDHCGEGTVQVFVRSVWRCETCRKEISCFYYPADDTGKLISRVIHLTEETIVLRCNIDKLIEVGNKISCHHTAIEADEWAFLLRKLDAQNTMHVAKPSDSDVSNTRDILMSIKTSLADEVMEIIAAAISGDCQKYLHYDLQGNRYCKWGTVEKDIRAVINLESSLISKSDDIRNCIWVEVDDPDIILWATSCGEEFHLETSTPSDNSMKYCCFCGKEIKEG